MSAREYALESLMYRTAGLVDLRVAEGGGSAAATLQALEEFAVEASIAKVFGSEAVDYIVDESIQIFGGNGFVTDYPVERRYRDARVNRIFEGTNEINRLLIPGMLIKRALRGELPLMAAAKSLQDELMGPPPVADADDSALAAERAAVVAFKKVALFVAGAAMQRHGETLQDEQEVLSHLADIVIDAYAAESSVLRAVAAQSHPDAALHAAAALVVVHEAAGRVELSAKFALAALAEGDALRVSLSALRRLTKLMPANLVTARRTLADAAVARSGYPFA
jgi:alkylation response protein AidB-like acyl-CoA dehydrogenase